MKKTLLTGIAALFLATGAAHAEEFNYWNYPAQDVWHFDNYKGCKARLELGFVIPPNSNVDWLLTVDGKVPANTKAEVTFSRRNLAKLEAAVHWLKKCRACFWNKNTQKHECLTLKEQQELDSK